MDTEHYQPVDVKIGFVVDNEDTKFLGWFQLILMYIYRWLWGNRTPVRFRHVYVCSKGECFDLTTNGVDFWREEDMVDEFWLNTVFVPIQGMSYDPIGKAFIYHEGGTHISRADIVRALLGRQVKGMFCASFAAKVLGLDVPLDIEPDSLYSIINVLPGIVHEDGELT